MSSLEKLITARASRVRRFQQRCQLGERKTPARAQATGKMFARIGPRQKRHPVRLGLRAGLRGSEGAMRGGGGRGRLEALAGRSGDALEGDIVREKAHGLGAALDGDAVDLAHPLAHKGRQQPHKVLRGWEPASASA